jgi:anti-sigma factor RsiW
MRMSFGGHIGSLASALVDGQLDHDEAERAWQHVLSCPPCRSLVEREGWVKRQLVTIRDEGEPPAALLGSLRNLDPAAEAWAAVDELEHKERGRRRVGLALAGAGSVSVAVFGIATLGASGLGLGGAPAGPPATSLTRSTPTSAPATPVIAPQIVVHGRVPVTGDDRDRGRQRSVVVLRGR